MTAKERLIERVTRLSEAEADETLRLIEARELRGSATRGDDLDTWSEAARRDSFRELDEEEAKIGFSWERYRHP